MKKVLVPLMLLLAVACTAGVYYLLFDGDTSKLWDGMGYQMQYHGVNQWKWCYRLNAVAAE